MPKQGKNTEKAVELAAWLTAPEQQVKVFKATGTFPSQVEALDRTGAAGATPTRTSATRRATLRRRGQEGQGRAVQGPADGDIQETAIGPALQAVEQGKNAEDAWRTAVDDVQKASSDGRCQVKAVAAG